MSVSSIITNQIIFWAIKFEPRQENSLTVGVVLDEAAYRPIGCFRRTNSVSNFTQINVCLGIGPLNSNQSDFVRHSGVARPGQNV